MSARRLAVPLVLPLAGIVLVATGCTGSGPPRKVEPPRAKPGASSAPTQPRPGAGLVKEGWFGGGDALRARVEIRGVERQGAKSVLRLGVTSLDSAAKSMAFPVPLVDPVGRKLYRPVSPNTAVQFQPNAVREVTAEYPPIPQNVTKVTALTPGTAGEFTGVPVTGTAASPAADAQADQANPVDLYDITEGEIRDVTSSGSDVTVNLRTDVLFAVDSAKLSDRAKAVLDQAAQEIKAKADPARRPLTITGHTDSKGADDHNLKLSRERAEAVAKELKARLGDGYRYSTEGKGETGLLAKEGDKDDAQARARNRRVEISYVVRQEAQNTTAATTSAAGGRGGTPQPAAFRAQDGKTVASRYGRFGAEKRRLDVKPFYRDGAYIVAVFDLVSEGPGTTPANAAYPHKDYPGGAFTSFSIVGPNGKDVYRAVRVGQSAGEATVYVDPGRAAYRTAPNQPSRAFVYIPAPPGELTTVVFDGGPFGRVNNVPVQ
ncbi:OmpA family protein [Actinomadura fulvescens]|uniref:OmpA-like domain-containing protein n=1 Tax=Actinomadura fulvescens TaxID=46160 RepID=A0ABN3Q9Z1_9ACTN